MNTLERLERGKLRIEKGWCKRVLAQNKDGCPVPAGNPAACKWCARGALLDTYSDIYQDIFRKAETYLCEAAGIEYTLDNIVRFNNYECPSQEKMVEVFDKAIALAKKETCSSS